MGKDKEIQERDIEDLNASTGLKTDAKAKDDDFDEWDLTAGAGGNGGGELAQIEAFLNKRLMVRCERYNANLTSVGCKRKKESPPPKLKNAAFSEEDNMQNHPCFACVGPVVINWEIEDSPIALHEVEKRKVIVHPGLEDDFTEARARQIQLYKEMSRPGARTKSPEELEKQAESFVEIPLKTEEPEGEPSQAKGTSSVIAKEAVPTPQIPSEDLQEDTPEEDMEELEPEVELKKSAAPKKSKDSPRAKAEPTPTPTTARKAAPQKQAASEAKSTESSTKKETKTTKKTTKKATKKAGKASKKPPESCASCDRPYEEPYIKNWRGDLCNPCYAKKLREKKKQKQVATQPKPKTNEAHAPCQMCGRAYEDPYIKNWRGDICNPCYAKKLRARKKKQKG